MGRLKVEKIMLRLIVIMATIGIRIIVQKYDQFEGMIKNPPRAIAVRI
ncbi:hypothetical protein ES708_30520 [subsurface metagenome]